MKTYIGIKLSLEGFHHFPNASRIFGDKVKFLEYNHRHIFHIECKQQVFHDNRDQEFLLLKRKVQQWFDNRYGVPAQFEAMSCEMIARELINAFNFTYVKVSEDDECYGEIVES